jgi:TetR/AcrR family transcriptional regulator, cholesterol catabolism regulator
VPRQVKGKKGVPGWRIGDRAGHIYRVAAEIMWRRGYAATSMHEIADAVGLTKAGLYHYIRGKEDLLFKIMSFALDGMEQNVIGPARQCPDAEERLRFIVEHHVSRILEAGGAVTILMEEVNALRPAHQRMVRTQKRAYFELVRGTLAQLAAEGKLRDLDPSVAAFSLLGMMMWTARWYRKDGKIKPQDVLEDFSQLALNAVLRSPAARAIPADASTLTTAMVRTQ